MSRESQWRPVGLGYKQIRIVINAGILLVLNHLSMKNPPISDDELTGGLAEMMKQYVAHVLD